MTTTKPSVRMYRGTHGGFQYVVEEPPTPGLPRKPKHSVEEDERIIRCKADAIGYFNAIGIECGA